jgi:hypothetical protein
MQTANMLDTSKYYAQIKEMQKFDDKNKEEEYEYSDYSEDNQNDGPHLDAEKNVTNNE